MLFVSGGEFGEEVRTMISLQPYSHVARVFQPLFC